MNRRPARSNAPTLATLAVGLVAVPLLLSQPSPGLAQSQEAGVAREGTADVESVMLTLAGQATEIRQILMEGGEMGQDGLDAAVRARELTGQAIEATGILGNPGDTQVTTTRMSAMDQANAQFQLMAEALDARIAAIEAGDGSAANQARLAAIDAINELPDTIRFGPQVAPGDNVTSAPGGAQPTLQQ